MPHTIIYPVKTKMDAGVNGWLLNGMDDSFLNGDLVKNSRNGDDIQKNLNQLNKKILDVSEIENDSTPSNDEEYAFSSPEFWMEEAMQKSNLNNSYNDEIFGSDDDNSVDIGFFDEVDLVTTTKEDLVSLKEENHYNLGEYANDNDSEEETGIQSTSLTSNIQSTSDSILIDNNIHSEITHIKPQSIIIGPTIEIDDFQAISSDLEQLEQLTPQYTNTTENITLQTQKNEQLLFEDSIPFTNQNVNDQIFFVNNQVTEITNMTYIEQIVPQDYHNHKLNQIKDNTNKHYETTINSNLEKDNNQLFSEDESEELFYHSSKPNVLSSPTQYRKRTRQIAFGSNQESTSTRVGSDYQANIPTLIKRRRVSLDSIKQEKYEKQIIDDSESKYLNIEPDFQPLQVSKETMKVYIKEVHSYLSQFQSVPTGRKPKLPQDTYKILAQSQYNLKTALENFKCKYNAYLQSNLTEQEEKIFSKMAQRFCFNGKKVSPCIQRMYNTGAFKERKISELVNYYFQNAYISDNEDSESDEEIEIKRLFQVSSKCPVYQQDEDDDEILSCQLRRPQ